jgi:hypothetical protein
MGSSNKFYGVLDKWQGDAIGVNKKIAAAFAK